MPAGELRAERTPLDCEDFFRVHDRLDALGLPRGLVQVRADLNDREPAWLDLEHPEGVNELLRLAQGSTVLTLSTPLAGDDDAGIRARDGVYEVEYYAELAAGTAVVQSG